jgi:hypothetical protein
MISSLHLNDSTLDEVHVVGHFSYFHDIAISHHQSRSEILTQLVDQRGVSCLEEVYFLDQVDVDHHGYLSP